MSDAVTPFDLSVPQSELDDLARRLSATRWPEKETVADWTQGAPLAKVRELTEHWRSAYDWRRCEAMLNGFGQYKTQIDGLDIHFLHIRSPHANALPLIITHGWPGSVIEFHKVIGPLTDPTKHGGSADDAFHLVLPSLPGFGFSSKPSTTGWNIMRIAGAWFTLMARLGYDRYVAQGGDWGAAVTTVMGVAAPKPLAGVHVNMPLATPSGVDFANPKPEEKAAVEALAYYDRWDSGYSKQQSTRPQTLGYGLADSPVGQAAWIFEKFWAWTDCDGDPFSILSKDELLDNIMLYWLNNSAASSARLYWESFAGGFGGVELNLPAGCSLYPKEIVRPPRAWVERCFKQLIHFNEIDKGGHFAAFEQPALFVTEIRDCFRNLR